MSSLKGKVALVTGANRGIGRAIALRFATEGALVGVHYRSDKKRADEVVAEIVGSGGAAFALRADIGSVAEIVEMFRLLDAELVQRTGEPTFDILVNNAGVAILAAIEEVTEDVFDKHFDVNVKGTFFVTQHAISRLRNGGRIIHLGSTVSRVAYPRYSVYAPTKGAIEVLNLLLAQHLGPRGITVNSIAPGAIDTEMNASWLKTPEAKHSITEETALLRIGEPQDIAEIAAFLASDAGRWVTGQRIEASGGWHM